MVLAARHVGAHWAGSARASASAIERLLASAGLPTSRAPASTRDALLELMRHRQEGRRQGAEAGPDRAARPRGRDRRLRRASLDAARGALRPSTRMSAWPSSPPRARAVRRAPIDARAAGVHAEAAAGVSHRIPARPRPHHPLHRVPPPRLQDAGLRESRGRPLSHAPHALARGRADRAHVARALRLNEDLVEAICLAHDLGHTPFGHAGQDALNACMRDRTAASSTTCSRCAWSTSSRSATRRSTG